MSIDCFLKICYLSFMYLLFTSSSEMFQVVEDESAELGSVMVQGSKKQNLNHLLNFHYAPRDMQSRSGHWSNTRTSSYNRNSNRWLPTVQRHKYNKEQFLQAKYAFTKFSRFLFSCALRAILVIYICTFFFSCQFVVTANRDYSTYLQDPDELVDWKMIEQIVSIYMRKH